MRSIAVIIPNYNRGTLITQTINNLLLQSRPPEEIIVVDDGSTDDSVILLRSFEKKIKLIEQANKGPGAARNAGLAVATGDFVQFQDSDDLLCLNKLELQARILDQTGADIILSPWAHVNIFQSHVEWQSCVLQQALPPSHLDVASWILRGWSTVLQSMLFRRSFLLSLGGFRIDLKYGEDMEFLFRIFSRNPRIAFSNNTLTLYRVDAPNKLSNDSGSSKCGRDTDWAKCLNGMIEECRAKGRRPDLFTRWIFLALARKHLRFMAKSPGCCEGEIQKLTEDTKMVPQVILALTETWLRVLERIRLARFGNRWMAGYAAGLPTRTQCDLVRELGFELNIANK